MPQNVKVEFLKYIAIPSQWRLGKDSPLKGESFLKMMPITHTSYTSFS